MAGERTLIEGSDWGSIVDGAAALEPGDAGGVVPHRLPAAARAQVEDMLFMFAEACPTGVSLRFDTAADSAILTVGTRTVAGVGEAVSPHVFVVRRDGAETLVEGPVPSVIRITAEAALAGMDVQPPQDVVLPLPGAGPVEVLLPHNASVELVSLRAASDVVPAPATTLRWTHYGSSISQGMNAVSPARTWPVAAAHALGWHLRNLSFSGNAQLDGFAARMIRDIPAEVITLKVGINLVNADSMRERAFRPALHAFLDTIREGQPDTPIVLISALSCPIHENTPGPVVSGADGMMHTASRAVEQDTGALTLVRTREILADVAAVRADPKLVTLDGPALFGDDDAGHLYDRLHPDQEGLDLIASRFVAEMRRLGFAEES